MTSSYLFLLQGVNVFQVIESISYRKTKKKDKKRIKKQISEKLNAKVLYDTKSMACQSY